MPRSERFADVLLRDHRCDLLLPLSAEPVMDALAELLLDSPLAKTLEAALGTDAEL